MLDYSNNHYASLSSSASERVMIKYLTIKKKSIFGNIFFVSPLITEFVNKTILTARKEKKEGKRKLESVYVITKKDKANSAK